MLRFLLNSSLTTLGTFLLVLAIWRPRQAIPFVLRSIGRIPSACAWLWEATTLRYTEVSADRAWRELQAFRKVILWVVLLDLAVGLPLFFVRWPIAKARALRILVERQVVQCDLAVQMYKEAVSEVILIAYKRSLPEALAQPHGVDDLLATAAVLDRLEANRDAMVKAQKTAHQAQAALPGRLWWWTPWADPLTENSFRADATREQIAEALYQGLRKSPEQQGWLLAVSQASQPKP